MTDIDIVNLALGWCGKTAIASFDDDSTEARLAKTFFNTTRDAVLEDRVWSFALKQYTLTPLVEKPAFGWEHAFELPREVISVHRVDDGLGDYSIDWMKMGRKIYSDAARLYVTAVFRQIDTSAYPPNFVMALAARLAAEMAIPLTQNRTLQADLWTLYDTKLKEASGTDGKQGKNEQVKVSWVQRARG